MRVVVVNEWRSSWNPCIEEFIYEFQGEVEELVKRIKQLEKQLEEKVWIEKKDGEIIIEVETCDAGLHCRNSVATVDIVRKTIEELGGDWIGYKVKELDP